MQEDETVLSDVHILHVAGQNHVVVGDIAYRTANCSTLSVKIAISRFPFDLSSIESCEITATGTFEHDEDGDLDVPRRRHAATLNVMSDVITIEHGLASPLRLVGLQVWLGAMLLSDYILHLGETLKGKTVLELGAGTGLCSIVSSIFAERVICTDIGSDILDVCQRNVNRNRHLSATGTESVLVRELDWRCGFPPSWSSEDELHAVSQCDIILAADVIYDDHMTDSFFKILSELFIVGRPRKTRTLYLSLERRLNFTLSMLDVSCPAYDYFLEQSEALRKSGVTVQKLPTINISQRFTYERSKYLELWEFSNNGIS